MGKLLLVGVIKEHYPMHSIKLPSIPPSLALLVGVLCSYPSLAAPPPESIESLLRRKTALEVELARVNDRIQALEASASPKADNDSAPTYYVKEFGIYEVNSAGGVEPYATFVNPNAKAAIKYIRLRATPYNAVGDVISSSIGSQSTAGMYMTGPLAQSDGEKRTGWEPIWYNHSATCLKIESVQVEFVNGKTLSFAGKSLRGALSPELQNDCRARKQ